MPLIIEESEQRKMNDRLNIKYSTNFLSDLLRLHKHNQITLNKSSNILIVFYSLRNRKHRLSKVVTLSYLQSALESNYKNSYINNILQCIIECLKQLHISNFNEYKSISKPKYE